ncbi:MAG: VOC family protein, partial [Acidobacteria bacterium]|nr:VOC family protein [Acidobacteriota bacterium]
MPEQKKRGRIRRSSPLAFNHAMVYVRELSPALHFYADLLGFKVLEQAGP